MSRALRLQEVGSGIGHVHNALQLRHVQKSVLTAPWLHYPTHPWSTQARNLDGISRALLRLYSSPGPLTMGAALLAALRN